MQPPAALVFVLDGILIGVGDTRYLAGAMAAATVVFLVAVAVVVGAAVRWCGCGSRSTPS